MFLYRFVKSCNDIIMLSLSHNHFVLVNVINSLGPIFYEQAASMWNNGIVICNKNDNL